MLFLCLSLYLNRIRRKKHGGEKGKLDIEFSRLRDLREALISQVEGIAENIGITADELINRIYSDAFKDDPQAKLIREQVEALRKAYHDQEKKVREQAEKFREAVKARISAQDEQKFLRTGRVPLNVIRAVREQQRKQLKEQLEKQRQDFRAGKIPQGQITRGSLQDVVAATVGDVQSTRFNKFKVQERADQQITLLEEVSGKLGAGNEGSFLKDISQKIGPPAFTQ